MRHASRTTLLTIFTLFIFSGCLGIFTSSTPAPTRPGSVPPPDPQAVEEVRQGIRTEAYVTWWGFDLEDSTEFVQEAIMSGASRVIIPNVGYDWIVKPISLRSDLELVLEDGVVITAKKGEYVNRQDTMFNARDVENLRIDGYGATLRMHKEDYTKPPYDPGEWRHTLAIRGGKDVEIAGLTLRDSGGDGIYLGRGQQRRHNENIVIRDVIADNNHRQGISVITVDGLLIEGSVFKNTGGTNPMAGIDFEPNHADELLKNIIVRDSVFEDNQNTGVIVHLARLNSQSEPIDMVFENIYVRGNQMGIVFNTWGNEGQPSGQIIVRNCIVEDSVSSGIRIRHRGKDPLSEPTEVTIEDCTLVNVANSPGNPQAVSPIHLVAENWLESVEFNRVTVIDNEDRPALLGVVNADDAPAGIYDISGQIDVVNPYGPRVRWSGPTDDISLTVVDKPSAIIPYDEVLTVPGYARPAEEVHAQLPEPEEVCTYVSGNLMTNPGFEQVVDGLPQNWSARGTGGAFEEPFANGDVSVSPEAARSGSLGLRMEMQDGVGNYFVTQRVTAIQGDKRYEMSAWNKGDISYRGKVAVKFEFYGPQGHVGETRREWIDSFDDWTELTLRGTAPKDATRVTVFVRLYGPGVTYYDDISLREIECTPL